MTLACATIPEDPTLLPDWLERQLVGLELGSLVADLAIVHGVSSSPAISLHDAWSSPILDNMRMNGLKSLSNEQLRMLLRQPGYLLELQELILIDGGPYWNERLEGRLADPGAERLAQWTNQRTEAIPQIARAKTPVYRQPWLVSLATAAVLLVGVYLAWPRSDVTQVQVASTGWGWNRADALPSDMSPTAYLNQLADEGNEWFAKRPDDAQALARRLNEMRQGCSNLILASHTPLKDADRRWLVEKCQAWAKNLDKHLVDLEQGTDVNTVRAEADATVNRLVKALRERATTV